MAGMSDMQDKAGRNNVNSVHMSGSPELTEENISKFNDLLKGMRYGTITVIVQDGRIIQMDKTEKHRL